MTPEMRWKRIGVEYRATSQFYGAWGSPLAIGWCAHKDGPGWTLGLLISVKRKLTGKHIAIGHAGTLREVKLMASSAANQLYHDSVGDFSDYP